MQFKINIPAKHIESGMSLSSPPSHSNSDTRLYTVVRLIWQNQTHRNRIKSVWFAVKKELEK
jgi:hypothetical protein